MKRKSSKRLINKWTILSLLALATVLTGALYYNVISRSSSEERVLETSTIGTGDIILSATGIGTLIPVEEISLGFKSGGQVAEVLVGLGERVEAGQTLARLENVTLALKYRQAEANLSALSSPAETAAAEQAVQEATQSFATARNDLQYLIGPDMLVAEEQVSAALDEVAMARAAAEEDPSDANQRIVSDAESNLAKAQETLTYANYSYSNRYTVQTFTYPIRNDKGTTVRRELIAPTDAELLAGRAAYELARAQLQDAQNYLDVLKGIRSVDDVPASSVTPITEANLALAYAKANLDATELIAPISGTITSIELNPGDYVGTASVIAISNLTQPYTLDVYLDETDWDKAKVGSGASVTFDLLPDESYPAKVVQVFPALAESSGTAMVHVLVQLVETINSDLPAGSSASVEITGGEALGAILVPTSGLKEESPGSYVVYLLQNGEPVKQAVEIGLQDLLYAEVKSGLQRGDVVLTDAAAAE